MSQPSRSTSSQDPELLTTGQAAAALGVKSVNTVKAWVRQGTLEGYRRGSRILVLKESVARLQGEGRGRPDNRESGGETRREASRDVLSSLSKLTKKVEAAERARVLARTTADIRRRAAPVLRSHGLSQAFLFGSAARGDIHSRSDLDIAVEVPRELHMGLFELVGIELELEAALGRKVDLVSLAAMKPTMRQRVEHEMVPLL